MKTFNLQDAVSIKVSSVLLLLIPIINISLLMTSNHRGVLGPDGTMTSTGGFILAGLSILILTASVFFTIQKHLFRLFVLVICISIPVIFVLVDTNNYTLQTVVITITLFFLLYLINIEVRDKDTIAQYRQAMMLHNVMLLGMIGISARFELFKISWNRLSILIYLVLYAIAYLFGESKLIAEKKRTRIISVFIGTTTILASFFVFADIAFLFAFLFLLYLLFFQFHAIRLDRMIIDLLFDNPYKLLISSFGLIVLCGTILLSMPFSSVSGEGIPLFDCLFTATSAVCVTGLVVLDTYRDFSFVGQAIILILIQVGGLGIVTIMTFVSFLLGQAIGIRKEFVVGEIVGSKRPKLVYDLIKLIVFITIFIEAAGALVLATAFYLQEGNLLLSLWKGVFHAISAFCNAGFALQGDSLTAYNNSFLIPVTICILVIIGGLGFPVISHLVDMITRKSESRRTPILVKVSLIGTAGLILAGYLFFLFSEFNQGFADLPPLQKHVNAFFLSVSARTAGFNSIDMQMLSGASIIFLWLLMFIGAGSCSTAGGIKITTASVLFATIASFIRGRSKTILFEKRLPEILVMRATVMFVVSTIAILVAILLLQLSQDLSLSETVFETISAFGTVGLSIGATEKLDDFGKFLIVMLMFIGRVNILTFISLFVSTGIPRVQYPEESIMIG